MRIGRGNRSTRGKPAPVPLCPPQIPHDLTWDRTPLELWHGQTALSTILSLVFLATTFVGGTEFPVSKSLTTANSIFTSSYSTSGAGMAQSV
jgi:hypothetical protein